MLIRHAEKPETAPPYGVDEQGAQNADALIVLGWQRAGALVSFFTSPAKKHITVPKTLYASSPSNDEAFGEDSRSLRPMETLTPLAQALAGSAPFITSYILGQEDALVKDILQRTEPVLVAWEHKRIPLIAKALKSPAPTSWPEHRFDVVWVLHREADETYSFTQVNQSLLPGDE
jgi:hypothetical protein